MSMSKFYQFFDYQNSINSFFDQVKNQIKFNLYFPCRCQTPKSGWIWVGVQSFFHIHIFNLCKIFIFVQWEYLYSSDDILRVVWIFMFLSWILRFSRFAYNCLIDQGLVMKSHDHEILSDTFSMKSHDHVICIDNWTFSAITKLAMNL